MKFTHVCRNSAVGRYRLCSAVFGSRTCKGNLGFRKCVVALWDLYMAAAIVVKGVAEPIYRSHDATREALRVLIQLQFPGFASDEHAFQR